MTRRSKIVGPHWFTSWGCYSKQYSSDLVYQCHISVEYLVNRPRECHHEGCDNL